MKWVFIFFFFISIQVPSQILDIHGNLSTKLVPVRNARITFINNDDTTKQYSVLTDSLGNFILKITITSVNANDIDVPKTFKLEQNYPNPFSNKTAITYKLNKFAGVSVKIYNVLGQQIRTFTIGGQYTGFHGIIWDGKDNFGIKVPAGVYFYKLQAGNETQVKKMIFGLGAAGMNNINLQSQLSGISLYKAEQQSGAYRLGASNCIFKIKITNTDSTQPKIYDRVLESIAIQSDTSLNYIVEQIDPVFAIYFLKDSTKKIDQVLNTDLSTLELNPVPWITEKDIDFYDWSSQFIYLKKDKSYFFPDMYSFIHRWTDKPWIVVANSTPYCAGCFRSMLSSKIYLCPYISELEMGKYYPDDIITSVSGFSGTDVSNDNPVKKALIKANLYHAGIEILLDSMFTPTQIINNDTTTFEYTFQIKNNDQDDLYIFDPGKVDSKFFFYYNNGPSITDVNTFKSYGVSPTGQDPGVWDSTWYSLIKGGESIIRTIRLKAYPLIPSGDYYFRINYSCPNVNKNARVTTRGRYWIGQTSSNKIRFTIN